MRSRALILEGITSVPCLRQLGRQRSFRSDTPDVSTAGLTQISVFEVPLNSQIFHLDISPVGGYGPQQRFIFDKVEDIF